MQNFITAVLISGMAAGGIIAMIWLAPPVPMELDNSAGFSFMVLFLATIWPGMVYVQYAAHAKGVLLPNIISFFSGLKSDCTTGISHGTLSPFGILPAHDIYLSEDYIHGNVEGVGMELGEITLKKITRDSKGREREHTVFHGAAVVCGVNKPFKGQTIIRRDAGKLGNMFAGAFQSLDRVSLEDPKFEKYFEVYSSDQVEARYLLTTAFMERLILLAELMLRWGDNPGQIKGAVSKAWGMLSGSSRLQVSFKQGQLLLLIPCKRNLFEPGSLFTSVFVLNEIRCVLYQLFLIRQIVDVLKLDQDIGL